MSRRLFNLKFKGVVTRTRLTGIGQNHVIVTVMCPISFQVTSRFISQGHRCHLNSDSNPQKKIYWQSRYRRVGVRFCNPTIIWLASSTTTTGIRIVTPVTNTWQVTHDFSESELAFAGENFPAMAEASKWFNVEENTKNWIYIFIKNSYKIELT